MVEQADTSPGDSGDAAPGSPLRNRSIPETRSGWIQPVQKYNAVNEPTETFTAGYRYLKPLGDDGDTLTCVDESDGTSYSVAKPWSLRQSTWDGLTVNGRTYEYVNSWARRVTWGDLSWTEVLSQPYLHDVERILAIKPENGTGIDDVDWMDANDAGRHWRESSISFAVVVSEGDDVLTCTDYATGITVIVAKPQHLRRTFYEGQTINGWTYAYSAADARVGSKTGETDETQYITPPYNAGDIIPVTSLLDGTVGVATCVDVGSRNWGWDPDA